MNTKTILDALDGGVLDRDDAIRKLCEAVDRQTNLLAALRQDMTAAINAMEIDAFAAERSVHGQVAGADPGVRAECDRLAKAEINALARRTAGGCI